MVTTISSIPYSGTVDTTGFDPDLAYQDFGSCGMGWAWAATWWSWACAADQVVTITMASTAGRYCHIFNGSTYVGCYTTEGAEYVLAAEAGSLYTFLVTTFYQEDVGSVTFNVDPTPANDTCALAYPIGFLPSHFFNSDTTGNDADISEAVSEAICGTGSGYHASWLTWTAPEPYTQIQFSFATSATDAVATVFTGACGSLTYLTCFYASTPGGPLMTVVPGTTYYFLITGVDADPFYFTFNLSFPTTYLQLCKTLACPGSSSPSSSASASPSASASASPSPAPPRLIRRMRQSPHLSDEQVWLFFSQFQLDLEAGLGAVTGRVDPHGNPGLDGVEPQVMLQWSNDSGHTWSDETWTSAGRLGAYKFRAIWRRLGRGRQRVWRIVVTDPIAWRLLDAFVHVEKGTS
jgi:hypothetical protein